MQGKTRDMIHWKECPGSRPRPAAETLPRRDQVAVRWLRYFYRTTFGRGVGPCVVAPIEPYNVTHNAVTALGTFQTTATLCSCGTLQLYYAPASIAISGRLTQSKSTWAILHPNASSVMGLRKLWFHRSHLLCHHAVSGASLSNVILTRQCTFC